MRICVKKSQQHQVGKLAWCFFFVCLLDLLALSTHLWATADSTLQARDSISLHSKVSTLGSIASERDMILGALEKDSIRNVNYSQFGDLLFRATSFPALSQGSLGQWDGIEILGTLPNQQVVSHNGVPVFSLTGGSYQPLTYSPSAVERIEILAGTDAIGGLPALAVAGINVQKISYNSARPFTSMWYHQGAGDLVAGNVAFAQNISRSSSVAVNVRRTGARGVLQNTDFDAWNVHLQGRIATSNSAGFLITYDLSTIDADPWGGVIYDPNGTAELLEALAPKYTIGRESTRRHDVSAAYELRDIADSAVTITTTAYASNNHLGREDTLWTGWYAGILSTAEASIGEVRLHGGLRMHVSDTGSRRYTGGEVNGATAHSWAKMSYDVANTVSAVTSVRYDGGTSGGLGYGASVIYRDSFYSAKIDASWIDRTDVDPLERLLYTQASWHKGPTTVTVLAYQHRGMQVARDNDGVRVSAQTMIGSLFLSGAVQTVTRADSIVHSSILYSSASLAYVYSTSSSSIHIGAEYCLLSGGALPSFDVYQRSYTSQDLIQTSMQNNGLSLFARALVGTACIRASLDNVIGQRWYTVAFMPELPRQFRLSVDWTFVD
jgi:hypothetical protein